MRRVRAVAEVRVLAAQAEREFIELRASALDRTGVVFEGGGQRGRGARGADLLGQERRARERRFVLTEIQVLRQEGDAAQGLFAQRPGFLEAARQRARVGQAAQGRPLFRRA